MERLANSNPQLQMVSNVSFDQSQMGKQAQAQHVGVNGGGANTSTS